QGQIDKETRERWTAGLRAGLARGVAPLVEPGEMPEVDASCDRKGCYDKVRSATGATHVVRTTLVAKNRDFLLKLDLVDAETGEVTLSQDEVCEICGSEEVVGLLDSQGALLQTRLDALGTGPAVLILDSKPRGAMVTIDGEVVGTTPLERPVLEGVHTVRLSLDGHVAEERELTLVNGAREQLSLTLKRTPGNAKSRALGAAGLGGGLALLGAGIALLVLDDKPYKANCSGENVDKDMDCRFLFNTAPLGGALIGVGAVLATLGAVALYRNRGAKAPRRAMLRPGGLGVVGRF
ncbi:MAG TPA: PEGA domain-containing protein, partial [Nannocystis sp.]